MIQGDLLSYRAGGPGYKTNGTSREAAEKVASTTEAARARILNLLWHSKPMTADEICAAFEREDNPDAGEDALQAIIERRTKYWRPRCSELFKHYGAIKKAGRSRNASGLSANLWTIA